MRVAHIITRLIIGGAQENTVATVLGLLNKPGVQVRLISGPSVGPEGSLEGIFETRPGVLSHSPHLLRPVHPWHDVLALRDLRRDLKAFKPEIVHTHSGKAGILGRMAAAKLKVPVVIHHIHGPSFGDFQGRAANGIFTAAERHAGKLTTHFLCSASAMARAYIGAGIGKPEQYTRVFSGFDVQPFVNARNDPALRRELSFAEDDFVIGKIGRLAPLKGHGELMLAFKALLPQVPRARLLLVGDGALRKQLETEATRLGIASKVEFAGLVPPAEVPRYCGIMDCLVHLSRREAVSRALPQALAAGKPVIAYDFQGADEVCLDGETGFVVRTGDVSAVTEKLLLLWHDAALRHRLGVKGQALIKTEFPVQHMVDKIFALYQELTTSRRLQSTLNTEH